MIYLVDIDGTLANLEHRLHFIEKKPADWDGFFDACDGDAPIPEVIDTINLLHHAGATILLVSGRSDAIRDKTLDWLDKYLNGWHGLYMRKAGDHRPDNIVKGELLNALSVDWDVAKIRGVFEDRKQVVDMYRERGLRVFQVAEGNF
jgi:phosphoglycolate phosphatase-like HAD superfamily hydrolase